MKTEKNYDLDIKEIICPRVASNVKQVNFTSLLEELNDDLLDFDPPYQRGRVWKKTYRIDLILSILKGIPIGAVHFVKKAPNSNKKWVLDAKQRMSTFYDFINDPNFKIRIKNEDGKIVQIGWRDIKDKDSKYNFLYERLKDYQITKVLWDHCDFKEQKLIFEKVNNNTPITGWESMYAKYFLTRQMMKYCFDNAFIDKDFLNASVAKNYKDNGIKSVHALFCLCFGYDLEDVFTIRPLTQKNIEVSCRKIEDRIIKSQSICQINEKGFDNEILIELGYKDIFDTFKCVSKWFNKGVTFSNEFKKGKKFESIFVQDVIGFFIKKHRAKILTNSYVEQNYEKIYNFIKEWHKYKNKDVHTRQAIKSRSTMASTINFKFEKMEEIFANLGFDNQEKNKKVNQNDKTLASLVSPKHCPITGMFLTDDNVQFDHILAKGVESETDIGVLSDIANRRKSDQTLVTIEKTCNYIKEKT